MVQDVTERWTARRLLSLVNEAGTSVGTTLDVMRTAQELADFAVPRFADFVIVDLLESVLSTEGHGAWLSDAGPAPARPVMRRAGMRSVREGCPEAVARIEDRVAFLPPPHDASLLVHGEPILLPVLDPSDDVWLTEQPERAESIRAFGLHSLISVPMRARNTALGLTTFIRSVNPASFQPDDVLPARELVARAALCVDNARRYTREHTAAVTLQRSLLPHALTGGRALEIASAYLPADPTDGVGGDWFDVIPLSGARVGLVVGDVVGHGIAAAATMGRLRTAVQTLADMEMPPDELLPRRPGPPAGRGERRRRGRARDDRVPRRDLPVRRLRPRHPPVPDGPRRTPAPRRRHPRRPGDLPRAAGRSAARPGRNGLRGHRDRARREQPDRSLHRRPHRGHRP